MPTTLLRAPLRIFRPCNGPGQMTHYTNQHTFKQHSSVCIKKSVKLRQSYAFVDFWNIAQSVN
jgi:hypothetical protein